MKYKLHRRGTLFYSLLYPSIHIVGAWQYLLNEWVKLFIQDLLLWMANFCKVKLCLTCWQVAGEFAMLQKFFTSELS